MTEYYDTFNVLSFIFIEISLQKNKFASAIENELVNAFVTDEISLSLLSFFCFGLSY